MAEHWTTECMTCNHRREQGQTGLCDECESDYQADPIGWMEFGYHPQGIAAWEEVERLMEECRNLGKGYAVPCHQDESTDDVIPF